MIQLEFPIQTAAQHRTLHQPSTQRMLTRMFHECSTRAVIPQRRQDEVGAVAPFQQMPPQNGDTACSALPDISNNVSPVKLFLCALLHPLLRAGSFDDVFRTEVFPLSDDRDANQEGTSSRTGKGSGGPKTHAGKQNSKNNALKHGIFSKVALLKGESPVQLDYLLSGLRNDFAPNGTLEELLVDKLAALAWRHRRLILAEEKEIRQAREIVKLEDESIGARRLELLLRYESNLERNFDRTLSQLERLQRSRRGQPEPPTLNVNLSSDLRR